MNMKYLTLFFAALLVLSGCNREKEKAVRSMFYWSTDFNIDREKASFLKRHNIKKLYVRFFDVVRDDYGRNMPNATVRFSSKVPRGTSVVPVVFIVNDCMKEPDTLLAEKIFRRIRQMNETNDIGGCKEIQIDCDWTNGTRNNFFSFMKKMRDIAHRNGTAVSATIRLHQLRQSPPPADRGVLMMYNTGDFTKLSCEKPILDMNDAAPYLYSARAFSMPMSAAYPIFGWKILFRKMQYVGIIHSDDFLPVLPGDSIADRHPSLSDILAARNAIEKTKSSINDEIILFDLSHNNIKRYDDNDYEKIFSR